LTLDGPEAPGFVSHFERAGDVNDPLHYPVFPALVGAVCTRLLTDRLHLLTAADAQHLGLILLHVLGLFFFISYCCRLLGRAAGICAGVVLATFPAAVGHSFNNAKDWPCAMFYAVTVLAAGTGLLENRGRSLLAAGVFLGLSFAGKFNAVFVFPTLLLWLPLFGWVYRVRERGLSAPVVGGLLGAPYVAFLTFFVLWPWLYQGTLPQWLDHLHEYVHFMVSYGLGLRTTWTALPFLCVLLMTPPLVLVAAGAGILRGTLGGKDGWLRSSLLGIGLLVPVLRVSVPRSNFYDANRHFIEYIPFLAGLAGYGAPWLFEGLLWLQERTGGGLRRLLTYQRALAFSAALALFCCALPLVVYAPYETTYWNAFVGGLGGAQRRAVFLTRPLPAEYRILGTEGDYWLSSARMGMKDALSLLTPGETLGTCGGIRWILKEDLETWGGSPQLLDPPNTPRRTQEILVMPREGRCGCKEVRSLEAARPILRRVEREGGLIYEVLGPEDGRVHAPTSADSPYCQI
jgi:hypothetical protein